MALEGTRDQNDLKRPDTSKCSRSSNRSNLNITMSNFNANGHGTGTVQVTKRTEKKNGIQTNFHKIKKEDISREMDLGPKYSVSEGKNDLIPPKGLKKQAGPQGNLPDVYAKENGGLSAPVLDFNLHNVDKQKGITLDKVLGGGFKKINIFDANLDEFANGDMILEPPAKKKSARVSTSINEDGNRNFEITETENEDDANTEGYQSLKRKSRGRITERDEKPSYQESIQIVDLLKKKSKPRQTKIIYKKKARPSLRNESSVENIQTEGNETDIRNEELLQIIDRRRDSSLAKPGSKSLSPTMANEKRRSSRVHSLTSEKQKIPINGAKYNIINDAHFLLKKNSYDVHGDLKNQTQTKLRISMSKFKNTKENLKTDPDHMNTSYGTKPLQIKALLNTDFSHMRERELSRERKPDQDLDRTTSRSGSVANTDKFLENARKVHGERMSKNTVEHKLTRDNKLIAEKIKRAEQDIISKYSKMFNLNEEKVYLLKNGGRLDDGVRRLSTQTKDFDSAKYLPKKYLNP